MFSQAKNLDPFSETFTISMGNSQGIQNNKDENNKVDTPEIRVLPKIKDPRSPTEGIIRTPIEVNSTPKTASEMNALRALNADSPSILKKDTEINRQSVYKTQMEGVPTGGLGLYEKPYLETDLDAIGDGIIVTKAIIQHRRIKQLLQMDDQPVTRNNEETSQGACLDSLSSRIDRISFDDTSLMFQTEKNDNCMEDEIIVNQLETLEHWQTSFKEGRRSISFESLDESLLTTEQPKEKRTRKAIKARPFMTPDGKKTKNSPNPRRPLTCLSNLDSPKSGVKRKVWRGIEEERKRRGVHLDDENTPPMPPPTDKVSSAPGKLTRRRIVNWDHDATVFI
ncbi:hypothetical protein LSTR_LSTR002705 [Laodelphax striatellus]|uniref:Uncharacterized protein n=1 Tax=Laodelphax striatellus TaxID=195883 RepID=A0A482X5S5_LAOST|nr:hypothetical protein LSTR_LSTR002705 [Laodelphax striatellus]